VKVTPGLGRAGWGVALVALLVLPRLLALDADPPPSLDWTSGIWTDEGFYSYHARNAVLFGQTHDEFHPEALSPVLDAVQRAVFHIWGVGLTQARAISVLCSLAALLFFWDALRRALGARVALMGLLLLGTDAVFGFYNRLALLETPAALVVCAAFWALTWEQPRAWVLAGALAAGALAFKTTFLLFLPLPLLIWLARRAWRPAAWYAVGAAVGATLYWVGWGAAHGAEVWRLNHYYWTHQSQPRSAGEALADVCRALLGPHRSVLGFLLTRSPVLTALALAGLISGRRRPARPSLRRDTERLLWLWAASGLAFLAVTRYAPTRYDLVVLPALAGMAAVSLRRLPLCGGRKRIRRGAVPQDWGGGASCMRSDVRRVRALVLALSVTIGLGQYAWWYGTRGYATRDTARTLARIIRPGETLAGDWAPNLCLDNRVRAVPVLPDLANGRDPVGELRPAYILVAQTPYPVRFWARVAPAVVRPDHIAARFRVHDYRLILYRVSVSPAPNNDATLKTYPAPAAGRYCGRVGNTALPPARDVHQNRAGLAARAARPGPD